MSPLHSVKNSEVLREALPVFAGRLIQICRCTSPTSTLETLQVHLWTTEVISLVIFVQKHSWPCKPPPVPVHVPSTCTCTPGSTHSLLTLLWFMTDCHRLLSIKMAAGPFNFNFNLLLIILPTVSKQRSSSKGPTHSHFVLRRCAQQKACGGQRSATPSSTPAPFLH